MGGWLLLVDLLEQGTDELLAELKENKPVSQSVFLFLLVSHTILQMCQSSKVTSHCSETGKNLKREQERCEYCMNRCGSGCVHVRHVRINIMRNTPIWLLVKCHLFLLFWFWMLPLACFTKVTGGTEMHLKCVFCR